MVEVYRLWRGYYKVELTLQPITGFLDGEQQFLIEDTVRVVLRDTREEKLAGDQFSVRRLDFEVDVLRASRVNPWDDCCQLVSSVCIGVLVSAECVAAVVIYTISICLPEIQ